MKHLKQNTATGASYSGRRLENHFPAYYIYTQLNKDGAEKMVPFIIIRCYGSGKGNEKALQTVFEAQEKYPGLVNEIWFAGGSYQKPELIPQEAAGSLIFRERCRELNIDFSFQQGITLGHSGENAEYPGFSEDCWSVTVDGEITPGIFCPLSPAVQDYTFRQARIFMEILQPDSYWPDDDLRLCRKCGIICCCDRCMERFNRDYDCAVTRETLKAALEGEADEAAIQIRKKWQNFNSRRLSEFAAVFRKAADEAAPNCRLGLQAVSSSWVYDGEDHRESLKALSGSGHTVGIRPGALYFTDANPRDMVRKALDMLKEAANCRKYGFVDQICAEVENYPHVAAGKNPAGQLTEAAVMLACGVDSLALYRGADANGESPENDRFFFDLLYAYKPFLLAVKETFNGTLPSGIALYRGGNKLAHPQWDGEGFETETRIVCNSLPVTRMAAAPQCFMLDERCAGELAQEDFRDCFSRPVLLDTGAWRVLTRRFPGEKFLQKVKVEPLAGFDMAGGAGKILELFADGYTAADVTGIIKAMDDNVTELSSLTGCPGCCGSCSFDSGYGGRIILIQTLDNRWLWTQSRRKMILDSLDDSLYGGMPVRLLTGGFAVWVVAHTGENGRTAGVFLLNLGTGITLPLKIALRDPEATGFELHTMGGKPEKLIPEAQSEHEIIYTLPPLQAYQAVLIAPAEQK